MAQFSQNHNTVIERSRNKMEAGECFTPGETCHQSKPATKALDTRTLLYYVCAFSWGIETAYIAVL